MSKSVTDAINNRQTETAPLPARTEPKAKVKAVLVVEHVTYRIDDQTLRELPQFLPPDQTELSLVHLLTDVSIGLPYRHNHMQDLIQCIEERRQQQEAVQREFRTRLERCGFSVADERTYALHGRPLPELIEYIEQSGQDLAVFCADQYPPIKMGHSSAFMQMFAHLPVSGLLFKRHLVGNRSKPKILLAVDDSEASMTAVRRLPELLRTQDMDVILATVQSPVYQDNALLAPYVNQDVLDQALAGNTTMIFEMAQDILDTEGIPVQDVKRLMGSPAAELGYLAQVEEPDLLVVGSHNRKGVISWLMGSVSSQLLHWDTHNILIVR